MFSWLKRWWQEPLKSDEVIISASDILKWAQNIKQTKICKMQLITDTCEPHLSEAIANVESRLTNLLNANLLNDSIPERHRQICDGNRQAYADRLHRLTSAVILPKAEELSDFFKAVADAMRDFTEHSSRQKQVLSEFFAVELKEVGSTLLELENIINQLKQQWMQEKIPGVISLCQEATDFDNYLSQHEQLEEDASDALKLAEQAVQQQIHASALAKEAEADPELIRLREEHQALSTKRRALETNIRDRFAPLEVPLKKYARISPANAILAGYYSDDPLSTLSQDVHLKIIDILAELQKLTWSDQLDLKQDKKNKAIIAISNLTKDYLHESIASYARLCKEEQQVNQTAARHPSAVEAAALKQDAEQARLRHGRQAEEADRLTKAAARIDLIGMIDRFKTHASEFIGKPVIITQEAEINLGKQQ